MARPNTCVLLALLCASASAVECEGGSCTAEQDEISLVQKNLKMQSGRERIPYYDALSSTPVADYNAVTEATPVDWNEFPAVMDSFDVSAHEIKDKIEAKADNRIMFTNQQRLERKFDAEQAKAAVAADKRTVQNEIDLDKAAVAETERIRKERIDHAAEMVEQAKQNAEALGIKAGQAEAAAALGRKVGQMQGADASQEAWKEYKTDIAKEAKAAALKKAKKAIQAKEDAIRKAAADKTAALQAAENAKVKKADSAAELGIAKAAADGAIKRTNIGGPEGMKNRITEEKAEWAKTRYDRMAEAAQARIDAAARGEYADGSLAEDVAVDAAAGWGA